MAPSNFPGDSRLYRPLNGESNRMGAMSPRLAVRPLRQALAVACILIATMGPSEPLSAQEQFSLRVGVEQTSGDYGGSGDVTDLYVPVTGVYTAGRYSVRLTVPYLEVTFPQAGQTEGQGTTSVSGLGDLLLAASVFDVLRSPDRSFAIDLTGKIKFGTANEAEGLGTGENDYSVQMDMLKFLRRGTLIGTLGYTARGDPVGLDLDDAWYVSLGGLRNQGSATRIGLFFDYHAASVAGFDARRELSALVSHELSQRWQLQSYLIGGLSEASPDWGASVSARMRF
jgi:hypothetical protein